jgi:hypothetical protein
VAGRFGRRRHDGGEQALAVLRVEQVVELEAALALLRAHAARA